MEDVIDTYISKLNDECLNKDRPGFSKWSDFNIRQEKDYLVIDIPRYCLYEGYDKCSLCSNCENNLRMYECELNRRTGRSAIEALRQEFQDKYDYLEEEIKELKEIIQELKK